MEAADSAGFREIQDKVILPTFFAADLYAYSKISNLFTVGRGSASPGIAG